MAGWEREFIQVFYEGSVWVSYDLVVFSGGCAHYVVVLFACF